MAFYILLDYDNLSTNDKSRDLLLIVDKMVHKFTPQEINEKNVQVRLYGGWYENNNVTRKAQNLKIEILRNFPARINLADNKTQVIVNVELALSLYIAPRTDLFNTYRRRGNPSGITCEHPNTQGCSDSDCPIVHVYDFFTNGHCLKCITVTTDSIIFRQEQKLVDTMLTTDLIDIAVSTKNICIASSDEDMWPGIFYSVTKGAKVYHLLTKTTTTARHYLQTVSSNYFSKSLLI